MVRRLPEKVWNPRLLNSSHTDHLHGCYTLCNYEGAVRKIIIQLKYGGRIDRKRAFPPLLTRFPYWDRLEDLSLVMPVPLSKKKWESRGYNQVDMMFEDWMKGAGKTTFPGALSAFAAPKPSPSSPEGKDMKTLKAYFTSTTAWRSGENISSW